MAAVEKLITDSLDIWTSAIKAKSSAGRGGSKKAELYGIKKLRELILDLAVRGLLVPQNPDSEPAGSWLIEKSKERDLLVKSKAIKKPKKLPIIDNSEVPFTLPEGWEWERLGNFCRKLTDGSHNPPRDAGSGHPMLSSQNVNFGKIDFSSPSRYVTDDDFDKENNRTNVQPGDVLLNIVASIGRSAVVPSNAPQFVLQRSVAVIESPINPEYLSKHFISPVCLSYYEKNAKGTAQKGIYLGKLSLMLIAVPPIEEQHRIVAKVDELMTLCDQLEQQTEASIAAHQTLVEALLGALTNAPDHASFQQAWQRIAEHFDTLFTTEHSIEQLKQTILQLAVMGKLVPQDPNDEPASELLKRIANEKIRLIREGKIKKQKPSPSITDNQVPFELPNGWKWCRLTDVGNLARGKSKHRPRNDPKLYSNGSIPLVQTGDVARSDGIITTYTALYNEIGLSQSQLWPKGTMCITIAANIADTGILGFDACFPDSVVGYTLLDQNIDVKYFDFFIQTAKSHLEEFAPSTAQKNINLEILSQLQVPCPPAPEINRIVHRVQELNGLFDQLNARLKNSQTIQLHLANALTEQAIT